MTTTKTLIAKAEQLEADAKALRRAATLLNGHLTERAITDLKSRIAKAAAIRADANGSGPALNTRERKIARLETLKGLLESAPSHHVSDLARSLAAAGHSVSSSTVSTDLNRLGWRASGILPGA